MFASLQATAQKYAVEYVFTGKDTAAMKVRSLLKSEFSSKAEASSYINNIVSELNRKGYASASVDSVRLDSTSGKAWVYPGKAYLWKLNLDSVPGPVIRFLNLPTKNNYAAEIKHRQLEEIKNQILNYYENTGYPFARVYDESAIMGDTIHTFLKIDPRVLYHIDSIRIIGTAKIKSSFLQHYLDIKNGDAYNRQKLAAIGRLIDNLPYVEQQQPWDLMMLGTGATINLYLKPRPSSEINALVGFLPAATVTGKTKITADVKLNLKNALSGGETILLNWQQIEAQSPRLDLGFNQPFLFNSPYGIDFSFGMLKQDSSYLRLNAQFGVEYLWSANKALKIFYQLRNTYLLQGAVDTNAIRFSRRLPPFMDVKAGSVGLQYRYDNLNYRFNPRKGFDITGVASAGMRKVSPNADILNLKDPQEPDFNFSSLYDTIRAKTYLLSALFSVSDYHSFATNSVVKLSLQSGLMLSPQIFQNELFRIGGYRLLRGFDEESIYADRYGVATAEYRLLTGTNSFLFGFLDYGLTHSVLGSASYRNSFLSTGLGLELETGFGLLNISYAIGKRNDIKFDLRSASKIHFGYINYF